MQPLLPLRVLGLFFALLFRLNGFPRVPEYRQVLAWQYVFVFGLGVQYALRGKLWVDAHFAVRFVFAIGAIGVYFWHIIKSSA